MKSQTLTIISILLNTTFDNGAQVPGEFQLEQNYPNPFNPSTTISFTLPVQAKVNLSTYNARGQLVKSLVQNQLPAGQHRVMWHGLDENGWMQSSGVYFLGCSQSQKMVSKRLSNLKKLFW